MAVAISGRSCVMVFALSDAACSRARFRRSHDTKIRAGSQDLTGTWAILLSLLQISFEEIGQRFEQLFADGAGHSVAFAGIDCHVEKFPGLLQSVGYLHGVLE